MKATEFGRPSLWGDDMPALGIIPTIDSRLRDPAEIETVMKMAQAVKTLVEGRFAIPKAGPSAS